MNKIFANIQCGSRKNRSALDQLVRLESEVRRGFVKGEYVLSVFFDIEKTYDMTWRQGILQDMYNI